MPFQENSHTQKMTLVNYRLTFIMHAETCQDNRCEKYFKIDTPEITADSRRRSPFLQGVGFTKRSCMSLGKDTWHVRLTILLFDYFIYQ